MSAFKVGERIGAVLSQDSYITNLLGYGVYLGEEVPPPETGGFNLGLPNPKLQLDNGDVVWGCECWWGHEEAVRAMIEGTTIRVVSIHAGRKEANG